MIRAGVFALLLAAPGHAETIAGQAARASAELAAAITALDRAGTARDRVASLSQTIRAYESGLAALRGALREASLREAALTRRFDSQQSRIARLLGVLAGMEADPAPLLLLHPAGALGTARSAMMLADVTPALQAEASTLRAELTELAALRDLRLAASATLAQGLATAQSARTALSQAVSGRTDLPMRFTEDPEALRGLLQSADSLEAFAKGLSLNLDDRQDQTFSAAKGTLPLPVMGTLLNPEDPDPEDPDPENPDRAGTRRPGIAIATPARALVTAPWPATIRYRGPLLDYGNVMIVEPGDGYLLVLAGLDTVYGEVGEIVPAGAPLGLMGGQGQGAAEFTEAPADGSGPHDTETLYMELRQGAVPVNPQDWFAATARTGD